LKKLSVNDVTQAEDGTWWIHIHRQKTDTLSSVPLCNMLIYFAGQSYKTISEPKYSHSFFLCLNNTEILLY